MKNFVIVILSVLVSAGAASDILAQRRVSPVKENTNIVLPSTAKDKKLPKQTLAKDTLINDTLYVASDSLNRRMIYPLLHALTVGVDVWDPLMMAFKQSYGGIGISAELSLWNRIMPTLELGVGQANSTPEDMNFTYKGKLSPYARIGFNYNFLYNKDDAYKAMLGFRAGYSAFKYDITDIAMQSGYWGETESTEILNQKSHATWGELLFGIRVKLFNNLSMGWAFKYHFMWKCKSNYNSEPWYIPGYGANGSSVTGALTVSYTLPLKKKRAVVVRKPNTFLGTPVDDALMDESRPNPLAPQKNNVKSD